MMVGVFIDTNDVTDIRRGIAQLRIWEATISGTDAQQDALRELLELDTARLVRLAHEHFGTGRFTLPQLAQAAGDNIRVLHGLTGSLGRACDSRGVLVFDRHGGQPLALSVRQDVADLLAAEATAPAT